jgi:hypothetical protein
MLYAFSETEICSRVENYNISLPLAVPLKHSSNIPIILNVKRNEC